MARPKVGYVIFDMDGAPGHLLSFSLPDVELRPAGLLIDTESVYTKVTNEILAPYGAEMTWDIKAGLMGKLERDAAAHLLSFFPDIPLTIDSYLSQRTARQDTYWPTVQPLPGVRKLVSHLHAHGIPIAVATASQKRNVLLKTAHLQDIFGLFGDRIVCADDVRGKTTGKPDPYIFLYTARQKLGRRVGEGEGDGVMEEEREERAKGLVFEDAIAGFEAGKRAGMSAIWVPDTNLLNVEYSGAHTPDQILKSIEVFRPEEWGLPPYPENDASAN
ncbi:HAD-like domain-containing protein [Pisolithus marmoratus]|nr:HAD-like domain-containing protein [Pisolithus marmoratus]